MLFSFFLSYINFSAYLLGKHKSGEKIIITAFCFIYFHYLFLFLYNFINRFSFLLVTINILKKIIIFFRVLSLTLIT